MMLTFSLTEDDFYEYMLHTYSHSKTNKKKFHLSHALVIFISSIFVILPLTKKDYRTAIVTGIWLLACIFLYPTYYRYQIKRRYKKHVKENYAGREGSSIRLEFNDDHLFVKDRTGEGKTFYTAIEKVQETPAYFFLKLSASKAFILPKRELNQVEVVRNKITEKGLEIESIK
jgi:hypothetical protein